MDTCTLRILIHEIGRQLTVHAFCETSESEITKKLLGIAKPQKLLKSTFVVNVIRSDLVDEQEAHDKIINLYGPIATKEISVQTVLQLHVSQLGRTGNLPQG